MSIVFIASIVDVVGFSVTALAGVIGLGCSCQSTNKPFFCTFYCLIILISVLQIAIGAVNFYQNDAESDWLLFVEQIINNFSLVAQLGIMLTIAYGWSVISYKLRQEYDKSLKKLRRRRHIFVGTTIVLLVVFSIVTAGVVVYTEVEQTTLPVVIDSLEIVVYFFMIVGCFIQFHQGRRLSQLLSEFRRVIGIKISKVRFNMVYIVAFIFVLIRALVEMGRLVYELVTGFPIVGFWHSLTYFVLYTVFEMIPLVMYLIGIQVERPKEQISDSAIRQSIISDESHRTSRRETELITQS